VTDKSIGMFLRYTFTSRYKEILSKSHSSSVMTTPKFVPRLTREETLGKPNIACCTRSCSFAYSPIIPTRNLILFTDLLYSREVFEYARESMAAFKKWRTGGVRMQKASILGRKRKTKLSDGSSTP
jgi:GINS complex subunit 3